MIAENITTSSLRKFFLPKWIYDPLKKSSEFRVSFPLQGRLMKGNREEKTAVPQLPKKCQQNN